MELPPTEILQALTEQVCIQLTDYGTKLVDEIKVDGVKIPERLKEPILICTYRMIATSIEFGSQVSQYGYELERAKSVRELPLGTDGHGMKVGE